MSRTDSKKSLAEVVAQVLITIGDLDVIDAQRDFAIRTEKNVLDKYAVAYRNVMIHVTYIMCSMNEWCINQYGQVIPSTRFAAWF